MIQNKIRGLKLAGLFLFTLLAVLGVGGGVYWFFEKAPLVPAEVAGGYRPHREVVVDEINVPLQSQAVGKIFPVLSSTLSAEVSGQVVAVEVSAGDSVDEGQTLAQMDGMQYALEYEGAKKQEESLEPQVEQARRHYERTDRLFKKEAATRVEWENARTAYESLRASYDGAVKRTSQLMTRLKKTVISAPYRGVIGEKYIEPGDLVMPGSRMFLLYAPGELEVQAEVPEKDLVALHLGSIVEVDVPSVRVNMQGTVKEIVPYGNPESHTFTIKALLRDSEGILPTSYAVMRFDVGSRRALLIPAKAVRRVGQLEIVFVLDNQKWKRRYIRTGKHFDGKVEVLSGLEKGETVGYD